MLELNKVYNMDCIEGMKLIDDDSVDLVVTSPPYNIGINYGVYKDNLKWDVYLDWCEKWLNECFRILKEDGKVCINHYIAFRDLEKQDRFPLMDIRNIQEKIGFKTNKLIIWEDKSYAKFTAWGSWLSASSPHIQTPYEGILISSKKYWKKQRKGISTINKEKFMEGVNGIWKLGTSRNKNVPCVFPEKLPTLCIELLTYKDDIILDCFMGSGTTAVVCIQTGRNYIGFEIEKKYVDIAMERIKKIKKYDNQKSVEGWF